MECTASNSTVVVSLIPEITTGSFTSGVRAAGGCFALAVTSYQALALLSLPVAIEQHSFRAWRQLHNTRDISRVSLNIRGSVHMAVLTTFSFISDKITATMSSGYTARMSSTAHRPPADARQLADSVCVISSQEHAPARHMSSHGASYTFWAHTQPYRSLTSLCSRTWHSNGSEPLVNAGNSCESWTQKIARGSGAPRNALRPKPVPTSSGFLNHRTVHRGCGASVNELNETHDTTSTSPCLHSAEPQHYWEPQSELNCLVHAYNMLRGEKLLTPADLHSHTRNNLQVDATYLHLVSLDPTDLCTERGDVSLHCLNHFCLTTQNTAFICKRIVLFTPVQAIVDALSTHGLRGLLLTAGNNGANGHFMECF
jgi:hypothetical protein